ncbi:MAG: PAS domain S-box protein, partial [Actinobacteria bacterium]|nr:PAS domain S-box protein [Actinomycetota bacterium]NIS34507.1 PAS domain S-box protein [Actinomycetota bacterium]NIU69271.1 PAS domain S-box protein [Actinomycetota bacterium]NIV89257.1 PAS domain S-box protein [Actinomycetota bacterium]NIW31145.1 PAS domain S-box protein [Actinomycetota bacterium]
CKRKDGSYVWVAFRNRPILDADDNIVEVFSVGIDITDRKLREARLTADKERMEGELNIGREIQMSMLPERFPAFPDRPEFAVHAALEAAR